EPYTVLPSADGRFVYVSMWGGARVAVLQADSLVTVADLAVDEHPNAMALSNDGRRLFVACANSASVWSFDTQTLQPVEQIAVTMYPDAPRTPAPNSVSVSPDGGTLLVANADINAVAVVDISNPVHAVVSGFIPTGWYPTGAAFSRDGKQILALSGKGMASQANMTNGGMETRRVGSISSIATP